MPAIFPPTPAPRLLVLGGSGRVGRLLDAAWATAVPAGLHLLWQMRGGPDLPNRLIWAPLDAPVPPGLRAGVVLCLAGTVRGNTAALAQNTGLALAALAAGRAAGAAHVFLASSAAVYGAAPGPWAEMDRPAPRGAYGRAKLEMEIAARRWQAGAGPGAPGLTCLRIGNVAGADALLGGLGQGGPARLDRFPDGQGPRRAYIGPVTLAAVLARLARDAAAGRALPPVLNIAAPGLVAMEDLLEQAGADWAWRSAPAGALPVLALDTARLEALCPLPRARAAALVAEWRSLAGAGARA